MHQVAINADHEVEFLQVELTLTQRTLYSHHVAGLLSKVIEVIHTGI